MIMRIPSRSMRCSTAFQRPPFPNRILARQAPQERGGQQKKPVRRLPFKNAFTWFDRRSDKQQNMQQVAPDTPVRRSDSGPSQIAVGILLGAAILLLATWQRLTTRAISTQVDKHTLERDDVNESLGDALDAEAALQQRSISQQLQARIEQAKARIRQAPPEQRASIVKEEVQNLKALRQMASELYSYNAMSLEAEEMRAQLAGLKLQQGAATASSNADVPSDTATVDAGLLEQRRDSGASASSSSAADGNALEAAALHAEVVEVVRVEEHNEGEEVAELASRMWDSAEAEKEVASMGTLNGHFPGLQEANGHVAAQREAESSIDAEEVVLKLVLVAGGINLPHPAKASTGGEDAFFTSTVYGGAVGVADGVSGWAREGIDAALYSRKLMQHAQEGVEMGLGTRQGAIEVLKHANNQAEDIDGSTTALIAVMQPPNVCQIASLGDSGFRVIREGQCIFASEAQQHSFNCPFQLASHTRWPEADTPEDADVYEVSLLPGDILVLGSDGLFDNMWDNQLEAIVREHMKAQPHRTAFTAEALARTLAQAARVNALDKAYRSPFMVEAAAAGVLPFWQRWRPRGGKLDDCTVVVVFAELAPAPMPANEPAAVPVSAAA